MYFVCTDRGTERIAHATLEQALATLRSELAARQSQGYVVRFNDKLEFEVSRTEPGSGDANDQPYRLWVEDDDGQNVTSKDASEAG